MREETPKNQQSNLIRMVIAALFGTILGSLAMKLGDYLQRLWRQPKLTPYTILANQRSEQRAQCLFIASENLRAGIERRLLADGERKLILNAGLRNFREPWARDFGFASFGLLELGEYQATKECLEVFMAFQNYNGQFPVKIHSTTVINRFIHSLFNREQPTDAPLRPKYITAHNTISLDGNALLVIATVNYAKQAKDHAFLQLHWDALKRAVSWLEEHEEDNGLLHQGPFTDWADTVARKGKVLYTNVIYWKALHEMAETALEFGDSQDHKLFSLKADQIQEAINHQFWRSGLGYFITSEDFDNLSSSGNLLAIAWNLTTSKQAHSILDIMEETGMASPVPTKPVQRPYPVEFIAIENRLGGLANYHTDAAWLWLGAWHIIALSRMERMEEAEKLLNRITEVIVRDGAVHEVYSPTGEFLSNFWYTSEAPLTWSAGMVVHACHVLNRHLDKMLTSQRAKGNV